MMTTYDIQLIAKVQKHLETEGMSQTQLAGKVGISPAALSTYCAQKYKGNIAAVEGKINEYFRVAGAVQQAAEKVADYMPGEDYIPTSISEDVYQSIRFAQLEHCMVVLHGDAGVGKTKAARHFLQDFPSSAVYVSISPSTGTLAGAIKLLARALRVPESRNKMDQMLAIRTRLEGTNKVIIIDEAQHLKYAALEELRTLTDANTATGEHGVGVALIGNTEVYSRMQGKQQAQFAQLFSRIRMQRQYATRRVKREDVDKLFPALATRGADKELEFLLGICRSPWGIRGAANVYSNAANNENVEYKGLYAMAAHMGIGVIGA